MDGTNEGIFHGRRGGLTVGLLMAVTIVAFEALAVATVMPKAEEDLGHLELYGWTFSGFLLASIIGIAWSGRQADRHGPARPYGVGLGLFGVGLLIAGFAPSMAVLVLGRVVQGLGAGALPAISYVVIGRGYPEGARPRMLAMLATAWVVPGFVGPAIGGAVAEWISWRATFLMIVPLLPLTALLSLPALSQLGPPGTEPAPGKLGPAVRLTCGAGLALAGIATGNPLAIALLVAAGAVVGFPALRRLLPPGTLLARPGLPAAIAGNGFLNMAFFGADAFIPYLLTTYRGYSTFFAGLALTSATLSWTAGSWAQERLAERTSRAQRAATGGLLLTIGLAATSLGIRDGVPGGLVAVTWGVAGLGIGLAYPTFSLEMLARTPAGREGETSSAMKITETLAGATGIGIAGGLVAAGESGGWAAAALVAVFVLAGAGGALAMFTARGLSREVASSVEAREAARQLAEGPGG